MTTLEQAITNWYKSNRTTPVEPVFNALSLNPALFAPVNTLDALPDASYKTLSQADGTFFIPLFTSAQEAGKGPQSSLIQEPLFDTIANAQKADKCAGIIINPFSQQVVLRRTVFETLKQYTPHTFTILLEGKADTLAGDVLVSRNAKGVMPTGGTCTFEMEYLHPDFEGSLDQEAFTKAVHAMLQAGAKLKAKSYVFDGLPQGWPESAAPLLINALATAPGWRNAVIAARNKEEYDRLKRWFA